MPQKFYLDKILLHALLTSGRKTTAVCYPATLQLVPKYEILHYVARSSQVINFIGNTYS